jgi:predicted TIM-barrel fold metal-dependent hydrolase
VDRSRREIVENRHLGFKSHVANTAGLDIQPWPVDEVERAWNEWRKAPPEVKQRENQGTLRPETARKVRHHLIWRTCELAYELDVPFHIHSPQGEGQAYLSRQYPSQLENVVRYPVAYPQKPLKIVMIHGGYPHVDEAAYMAHLYPNVWCEISLMNPFIHRGLHDRMLAILETAPVSKVMYGSDGFCMPELFYLGAKNGRRYIASALATLVDEGLYTKDEAIRAARMMLWDNAHRLHKTGLEESA